MKKKTQQSAYSRSKKSLTETFGKYRIILAEDDYEMRSLLAMSLRKCGYEVIECSDGIGMLAHLETFFLPEEFNRQPVDLVISDIRMPGVTGMELLEGKPKDRDFPPMILITAFGDAETHEIAHKFGAAAIFDKPFDLDLLVDKVKRVLAETSKQAGNEYQ